jgi:hypothetical protein
MDLDVDIENIQFPNHEHRIKERREFAVELEAQEKAFSEEEYFTLENAMFSKSTKKLIFERLH